LEYLYKAVELTENNPKSSLWNKAIVYHHISCVYLADDIQDYEKALKYSLKSCQVYEKEITLETNQMEDLKLLKDAFQNLYERDGNKGLEYFDKATIIYELQNQPLKAAETQYKKGLGCWTAVCMT